MGKRIYVQRRGKGSQLFRAASQKRIAPLIYPSESDEAVYGIVEDLLHEPGRGAPIAHIRLENGDSYYNVAVEGLHIGQRIGFGPSVPLHTGNVLLLRDIPSGTAICNIERKPGDGGKLVRSSGTSSTIVSHGQEMTSLRLPSRKNIDLRNMCRATIGLVGASGRLEKPFMIAGERWAKLRAKGHRYPNVKGISMIASSHPHGGGRHRRSLKPTSVSRNAPPGQKVGLIAPKWSGRKKKQRGSR